MKTLKSLFSLIIALLAFVSCTNDSEELVGIESIFSRSISSSYYLEGADIIYTGAPEKYILKKTGSASLDGVYVINWNYSSDLYRVTSDNTSITLGRKLALGDYTISASLSNGESVSKLIIAQDSATPDINPVEKVAKSIYIRPVGIARSISGPYDNIDNYRYVTGQTYNMGGSDDLDLKCKIENTTSSNVQVNLSNITFAYGNSSEKYTPKSIVYENLNPTPSSVNIAGNGSVTVIFHLGYEWSQYILPSKVTVFKPYYLYYTVSSTGYGYLLTR